MLPTRHRAISDCYYYNPFLQNTYQIRRVTLSKLGSFYNLFSIAQFKKVDPFFLGARKGNSLCFQWPIIMSCRLPMTSD